MDGNLLKDETLGSLFCTSEVDEGIVAVTTDPRSQDGVTLLEQSTVFADLF